MGWKILISSPSVCRAIRYTTYKYIRPELLLISIMLIPTLYWLTQTVVTNHVKDVNTGQSEALFHLLLHEALLFRFKITQ